MDAKSNCGGRSVLEVGGEVVLIWRRKLVADL